MLGRLDHIEEHDHAGTFGAVRKFDLSRDRGHTNEIGRVAMAWSECASSIIGTVAGAIDSLNSFPIPSVVRCEYCGVRVDDANRCKCEFCGAPL